MAIAVKLIMLVNVNDFEIILHILPWQSILQN